LNVVAKQGKKKKKKKKTKKKKKKKKKKKRKKKKKKKRKKKKKKKKNKKKKKHKRHTLSPFKRGGLSKFVTANVHLRGECPDTEQEDSKKKKVTRRSMDRGVNRK